MLRKLDEVVERLKKAKKVLIMGHIKPDGDDISSVATLALMLRKTGKEAEGCIADNIPWFYKEIPGVSVIKNVDDLANYEYDTSITVDASEISRIGDSVKLLKNGKPDITLDHHKTNVGFGEYDFYDSNYAATAVIVYEIGKMLGIEYTPELAEINLLGIATDTGFFKYSNTDRKVFQYASELVGAGANIQHIASAVLEHKTLNEIKLQSEMINTLKVEENGKLAWAYISYDMFKRNNCTDEDAGGFVSDIRALYGVEVAILFIEWPENQVNISFRSKNYVDVSEIALAFGGGGHERASGCSCKGEKLEEMMEKVIAKTKEILKKY
ncbi:DHH family phosphoesterase [Mesoaciditoga lauensis]|uniref:DHH family phosphoesterase n=1 Tax=Mesoaciditoga lauensis TaxID=1495039 RepID=UPI000568B9F9|nr:bifunctional oligoribonuclease/PAP phosphatase NrnA [Mesoaciditoga lauensis]